MDPHEPRMYGAYGSGNYVIHEDQDPKIPLLKEVA